MNLVDSLILYLRGFSTNDERPTTNDFFQIFSNFFKCCNNNRFLFISMVYYVQKLRESSLRDKIKVIHILLGGSYYVEIRSE